MFSYFRGVDYFEKEYKYFDLSHQKHLQAIELIGKKVMPLINF